MGMESILNILTPAIMLVSSLFGFGDASMAQVASINEVQTVEIGLTEVSPKGASGGFAMPASGCSAAEAGSDWHTDVPIHDCATLPDIRTNSPIIRLGDPVTVSWDPRGNVNCILSNNVMTLVTSPNSSTAPNGNAIGSRVAEPTGETTYTIVCDGADNRDAATVKVLPRIQET
jgi:hypothetical protein